MSTKYTKDKTLQAMKGKKDEHISGIAGTIFAIFLTASMLGAILMSGNGISDAVIGGYVTVTMLIGIYILFALKVASQWQKAVILRLGKFYKLAGPGAFWIIPVIDTAPTWIDHRVMVTPFSAEKTLTKDTVPVDVDAVLFWVVWDGEKAALEVEDYKVAIAWAAQTALREIIGQMD
jgi:regulator of protease activity HflC (stomatin/prohibitin superfamily)